MNLLDISYKPAIQVSSKTSVKKALASVIPSNCNAVAVMDHGKLKGILTSRDVMLKVVLKRRDPQTTAVGEIMTSPVVTLHPQTEPEEALEIMLEKHFRHLPLSEDGVTVCGMLSLRKVLNYIVEDQRHNLVCMEAFLNADGPGG